MLCAHKSISANSQQQTNNLKQRALTIADRQGCKAAGCKLQGCGRQVARLWVAGGKAAAGKRQGCGLQAARLTAASGKAVGAQGGELSETPLESRDERF